MSVLRVSNGVRSHSVIRRSAAAVAALSLATLGLTGTALAQLNFTAVRANIERDIDPDPMVENRQPLSGLGIFGLGETEPSSSDPTGQTSDGFAIARWVTGSPDGFYAAAISSGFFSSQPDSLLGFVASIPSGESTTTPGKLAITRNVTLTGDAVSGYDTFGLGNIADNGLVSFRTDGGSGGGVPNYVAQINVSESGNNIATVGSTSLSFAQLSAATSTTLSVPGFDLDAASGQNIALFTSFNREIRSATASIAEQVERTFTSPADTRGSVTYNATAGRAVVFSYNGSTANAVKIYTVSIPAVPGGDVVLTDVVTASLPSGAIGTNFFSRTAFAGTHQIAMNDSGDIAVPVVFGTNAQNGIRRGILVAHASDNYATWETAADSGATGNGNGFRTDNPTSTTNELAISSPALDNDGNVYFAATSFISGTGTVSDPYNTSQAVYKSAKVSGVWTLSQVLRTGDDFQETRLDPLNPSTVLEDQKFRVMLIPVQVASSNLSNANCRFNAPSSIGPNAVQKGATDRAGLMVQALVAPVNVDGTLGTAVQKYLYISPGNATL